MSLSVPFAIFSDNCPFCLIYTYNTWLIINLVSKVSSPLLTLPPNSHAAPNIGYNKLWLPTYVIRESLFVNPFSWKMIENLLRIIYNQYTHILFQIDNILLYKK